MTLDHVTEAFNDLPDLEQIRYQLDRNLVKMQALNREVETIRARQKELIKTLTDQYGIRSEFELEQAIDGRKKS